MIINKQFIINSYITSENNQLDDKPVFLSKNYLHFHVEKKDHLNPLGALLQTPPNFFDLGSLDLMFYNDFI